MKKRKTLAKTLKGFNKWLRTHYIQAM
jgi:hypothetical protein